MQPIINIHYILKSTLFTDEKFPWALASWDNYNMHLNKCHFLSRDLYIYGYDIKSHLKLNSLTLRIQWAKLDFFRGFGISQTISTIQLQFGDTQNPGWLLSSKLFPFDLHVILSWSAELRSVWLLLKEARTYLTQEVFIDFTTVSQARVWGDEPVFYKNRLDWASQHLDTTVLFMCIWWSQF